MTQNTRREAAVIMHQRIIAIACFLSLAAVPAFAQTPRGEVSIILVGSTPTA